MRWLVATVICANACALTEGGLLAPDATDASVDATSDALVPHDATFENVVEGSVPDAFVEASIDAPPDAPKVTAGYALLFAGNAYVDMGQVPIPNDFTIEAWINPTSTNNETYIVAEEERNQGDGQFRFGVVNGALFFLMSDASGSTHGLYSGGYKLMSTATIPNNVWSHVAVVKSGAAFMLTINGASAATATADASFSYGAPQYAFRVAARVNTNGTAPDGNFAGTIDEVRLWSQALTPSQITTTMSTTIPGSTAGLASYWRFDEGSGASTADQVNNGYPGTLVSSPTWVVSTAF